MQETPQHRGPKTNSRVPNALSRDSNHHLTYPIQDSVSLKRIIGGPKTHISASVALIGSFPRARALKRVFGTRKHVLGPQPWLGNVQHHNIGAITSFWGPETHVGGPHTRLDGSPTHKIRGSKTTFRDPKYVLGPQTRLEGKRHHNIGAPKQISGSRTQFLGIRTTI